MTTLENVKHFIRLWKVALPHVAAPSPEDAIRWAMYPVDTVESAILQTARRFSAAKLTPDFTPIRAYKYVTATARTITQRASVREVA